MEQAFKKKLQHIINIKIKIKISAYITSAANT